LPTLKRLSPHACASKDIKESEATTPAANATVTDPRILSLPPQFETASI
jgi:hypothetical protein